MVAWAGIEPATHGFSVHCSTTELRYLSVLRVQRWHKLSKHTNKTTEKKRFLFHRRNTSLFNLFIINFFRLRLVEGSRFLARLLICSIARRRIRRIRLLAVPREDVLQRHHPAQNSENEVQHHAHDDEHQKQSQYAYNKKKRHDTAILYRRQELWPP